MAAPPPPYPTGQPPPPAGYGQPAYGQPTTHVIVTQPMATATMSDSPVNMVCPSCRQQIVTSTTRETGTMTWVACLVLCFIGCPLCSLIPFCVGSCKDTVHSCPSCRTTLGRHNKM